MKILFTYAEPGMDEADTHSCVTDVLPAIGDLVTMPNWALHHEAEVYSRTLHLGLNFWHIKLRARKTPEQRMQEIAQDLGAR